LTSRGRTRIEEIIPARCVREKCSRRNLRGENFSEELRDEEDTKKRKEKGQVGLTLENGRGAQRRFPGAPLFFYSPEEPLGSRAVTSSCAGQMGR
jgi:hypothetical protein